MKKMTRNEFLKMAGTSAALVVFNTVLMPAAVAVEPGVVALSSKKSSIEIDKGTTVNSATFKLVPISAKPSGAMLVHVHLIICLKGISNGRLPFRVQ